MRIPRVRFTIRRLMVAVAVAGVFMTGARLVYHWRHYQAVAAMHASKEVSYVRQAQQLEHKQDWCAPASHLGQSAVRIHPWLFVGPARDSKPCRGS